jgi:multidrug efflux pump subunit AcrA (membrane-fusion protein)
MLAAVIAGASGVWAWRWITRERPIAVETAVVSERPAGAQAAILNATGYVTARRRATVSSKITGKLIAVNVEEGQAVRQGQVLARLDDGTLRASLALAHAQVDAARRAVRENEVRLHEAKLTLARLERLLAGGLSGRTRSGAGAGRCLRRADVDGARASPRRRAASSACADGPRRHRHPWADGAVLVSGPVRSEYSYADMTA